MNSETMDQAASPQGRTRAGARGRRWLLGLLLLSLPVAGQSVDASRQAMLERARALELPTAYVPPPGDPLEHHAAGYAKVLCSAVFVTGLTLDFAREHVGYFTAPYEMRARLGQPIVDRRRRTVTIPLPNGRSRRAIHLGDLGCVSLPQGRESVFFQPKPIPRRLPDPTTVDWPMGDQIPKQDLLPTIDTAKLKAALEAAFAPAEGHTAAFVATWTPTFGLHSSSSTTNS